MGSRTIKIDDMESLIVQKIRLRLNPETLKDDSCLWIK